MATVFMLCGLPGTGKTSLAKRLEAHGALALSLDDWMVARGIDDELSEEIAHEQWQAAAAALQAGRDVVLDWGFDSRQERDDIRARAASIGASTRLVFLDVPKPELYRRLAMREWPNVSAEDLDRWSREFEVPGADENPERVVDTHGDTSPTGKIK
jgi:predicted kinase